MTARVLIVEDETDLAQSLAFSFEKEGFVADLADTGALAIEKAKQGPGPDLVLLDLMLPDMSGLDICRTLRSDPRLKEVPIIMATASGEEIDRVVGFEVGADDYVVKPFSNRELMLRAKAVLRRRAPKAPEPEDDVRFGRLRIDRQARQVFVDAEERKVTALEFRLLDTLLERKGRVQTRETLLSDVWGVSPDVTTRTVDTHVKRLREKLDPLGHYVETVRGFGYRFRASPPEAAAA